MTKKRTLKITNALTGKARDVVLPGKPGVKKATDQGDQSQGGNSGKNKR